MTHIEIAVSDGPGALVVHMIMSREEFVTMPDSDDGERFIAKTLTEPEYNAFIEMHGGAVAT